MVKTFVSVSLFVENGVLLSKMVLFSKFLEIMQRKFSKSLLNSIIVA